MSTDIGSAVASTLGLDEPRDRNRFVRAVVARQRDDTAAQDAPMRLYEHKNGTWSVHGPDVALAARLGAEDLRAVQWLQGGGVEGGLETVWFGERIARELCVKVLDSGKKVEWYGRGGDGSVVVKGKGSPGCLGSLEELVEDTGGTSMIVSEGAVVAIKMGANGRQGVAVWDGGKRTLSLGEYSDGDDFTTLEAILVSSNSKEALFCVGERSPHEEKKIAAILEGCGVAMTERSRKDFDSTQAEFDLARLVGSKFKIAQYLDLKLALSACAALIGFLDLMGDSSNDGKVKISDLNQQSYMKLDSAALKALNIFPQTNDGGKRGSLFGLLNKTKTAMGTRLLRRWLAQPLQDMEEINSRLDITEALCLSRELTVSIREDHLKMMPDLNLLCRKFTRYGGKKATLQDVVRMYQCSVRLPYLASRLEESPKLSDSFASPLRKYVKELHNFEALVETTIDLDQIDNGEFVINPKIDEHLGELRKSQDDLVAAISDEHEAVKDKLSVMKEDQLKLERKDNLGYIFRLTRKDEKLIRGKSAYTVLETRKDGVRFQTRKLRRLSQQYSELSREYDSKESELRTKTLEVVATYIDVFADIASLLAKVDVLASFALVASEARDDYCRPQMRPAGSGLVLKDARHPMVEEMLDDRDFIPNDLDLRRDVISDITDETADQSAGGGLLIVTGPNMAGKSTFIRTAGVLTLMAHVGSFVPASSAIVPLTDRVLARVGAGDNQHRAISTFMSEMLETASILRTATSSSLALIDELGRGTGTMDGFGLAYSIAQYIAVEIKASCLFATHFHELTALANETKSVRNVHVTALSDPQRRKLTFLYKVREGPCDQSFGIHVAEMARFPDSVVQAAKRKAAELEDFGPTGTKRVRGCSDEERTEIEEGQKIIAEYLSDVRSLPLSTEAKQAAALKEARRLLHENVLAGKNSYIASLIESQTAS